jgi:hypothetical protein
MFATDDREDPDAFQRKYGPSDRIGEQGRYRAESGTSVKSIREGFAKGSLH